MASHDCTGRHNTEIQDKREELRLTTGLFPANLGKGPWPKLGKNDRLIVKLGEINDIERNKGSKICPHNQVILDCIMPSTPGIILIWVIVSHK